MTTGHVVDPIYTAFPLTYVTVKNFGFTFTAPRCIFYYQRETAVFQDFSLGFRTYLSVRSPTP